MTCAYVRQQDLARAAAHSALFTTMAAIWQPVRTVAAFWSIGGCPPGFRGVRHPTWSRDTRWARTVQPVFAACSVRRVTADAQIPPYKDLLWPTLGAVREMGDSGTIEEIVEKVIEREGFTEEQQSVQHGDGPRSEIEYRLAWARTYLKGMGALINSTGGVWSTTEAGRA